mmetsp:Transcript_19138/g.53301  ORF Transcript_19138/g.53301 Transcript_19138/m.53301 type:complete len:93 (-) Transcript_19138:977-1255(-)
MVCCYTDRLQHLTKDKDHRVVVSLHSRKTGIIVSLFLCIYERSGSTNILVPLYSRKTGIIVYFGSLSFLTKDRDRRLSNCELKFLLRTVRTI